MSAKAEKRRKKTEARKHAPQPKRGAATTANTQPRAKHEPKNPIRRMDGLTWLITRTPPRLSALEVMAGRRYGELCSEAARVELPGKVTMEGGGAFGSRDFIGAMEAIQRLAKADAHLVEPFARSYGEALLELMVAVCHHGRTVRDVAGGEKVLTAMLEERLRIGLGRLTYLASGRDLEAAE